MRMAIPYSRTLLGPLQWYSVLIVTGILVAIWLAGREERRLGLPRDTVIDLALIVIPCGIIGARLYYVAMTWELFRDNPVSILYIWEGGIAIYGGVIGGALGAWGYARRKKLPFLKLMDMVVPGLLLAQAIGRWGNYFNMEAYGPEITNLAFQFFPLGVLIPSAGGYGWHDVLVPAYLRQRALHYRAPAGGQPLSWRLAHIAVFEPIIVPGSGGGPPWPRNAGE